MKKIFIVVLSLVVCLCVLCALLYFIDTLVSPFNSVRSLTDINTWIHENIKYKSDLGDYWQTPQETLKWRTGDCEDMVILFQYIAKQKLNKDVLFLLIALPDNIFKGHVMASYKEDAYDPTIGKRYELTEITKVFMVWTILTPEQLYEKIFEKRD